jgi:hypothetical protein
MQEQPEWFRPTSGRLTGGIGVVVALAIVVLALLDLPSGGAVSVASGAAFVAVACWVVLLRPRVGLTPTMLVLRSMLATAYLPLTEIESMAVGRVFAVRVDGRRYVSAALGKPLRKVLREASGQPIPLSTEQVHLATMPYAQYVEARIQQSRLDAGVVRAPSDERVEPVTEVRTERAVPEIVALAVTALVFLVSLVL